ncbi:hypothetical protein [Streptosporangium sp. NPDC002721]|uniref:hypothetical protein n=1 Tax=Streptosporangium sp. NPDC002721 TaxID=3366188 RepID=UPI0036A2741F
MVTHEWNPEIGEKIGPAWRAVTANLRDREWGSWEVQVAIAARAGGILRQTACGLIRDAVRHGYLEARPAVCKSGKKYQQVRLAERDA